ncbi:response regulator [bacterium]|nr:response regulator [bacterium]
MILLSLYWFYTGASNGDASIWALAFPVYAFFVLGKREGLIWVVSLYITCLILFVLPQDITYIYTYSLSFKVRFIGTLTLITVITYVFELTRSQFQEQLQSEQKKLVKEKQKLAESKDEVDLINDRLMETNSLLEEEMEERRRIEDELVSSHDELDLRVRERTAELSMMNEELKKEISERSRTEERLRISEQRFSLFMENLRAIVFIKDSNHRIVYFNKYMSNMVGDSQLEGKKSTEIFPDDLGNKMEDDDAIALSKGHYVNTRTIKEKNGEENIYRLYKFRIDQIGNPPLIGCIGLDISESQRVKRELILAKEAAEQANVAKSNFLATMSHELRTPMNGVLGMAQLLENTKLTKEQQNYLRFILSSGSALLKVLSDILDISKIEAGKLSFDSTAFNLKQTIEDIIHLFSGSSDIKGIDLNYHIEESIPVTLYGDPYRLGQVLTNIIGNALKFTELGRVSLSISRISIKEGKIDLRFEISDTGIGISPENVSHVFESFAQEDSSTTRKYSGTGLGLTIAKNIVELMGGEIGVTSEVNVGSTFWFELAFRTEENRTDTPGPVSDKEYKTATLVDYSADNRFLVVEDDLVSQLVISGMLNKLGYKADITTNGKQALKKLEENDYAIILMDCLMPEMDGFETTRRIREKESKDRTTSPIPIIALTAKGMKGDEALCQEAGMDGFLLKPVNFKELAAVLHKLLVKNG